MYSLSLVFGSKTLPGVLGNIDPAMLQGAAQYSQRNPARLIVGDIRLELVQSPNVVEHVLDEVRVGPIVGVVGHGFFIVSKERVSGNYSSVKKCLIISYNFQLIDLWSINLGSWDLAADKSAIEIVKVRHKESMQMAN